MNKAEFLGIMKELNIAYGDKKFPLSKEVMDVWYKYLHSCTHLEVTQAVEGHIKTSVFPPTIAEILELQERLKRKRQDEQMKKQRVYMSVIAAYPLARDEECVRQAYEKITGGDIRKSEAVLEIIKDAVNAWEVNGKEKVPPLAKVLERLTL